jgi:hypothetical protein
VTVVVVVARVGGGNGRVSDNGMCIIRRAPKSTPRPCGSCGSRSRSRSESATHQGAWEGRTWTRVRACVKIHAEDHRTSLAL